MSYRTMPATHANRPKQVAINMNLRNSMAFLLYPSGTKRASEEFAQPARLWHAGAFPALRLTPIPRVVPPHGHQAGQAVQPDPFEPERQSQRRDDYSCYL